MINKLHINISYIFLILSFFIFINILLLSGLISYGNDTANWDIRYRQYASVMFANNDIPIWMPSGGNGFPHLSIFWISWVCNPIGLLFSYFFYYDYFTFALENSVWKLIGFSGAYLFSRPLLKSSYGAIAVGCAFTVSGVTAWTALSYSTHIGVMVSPWILAGGFRLASATTNRQWARAVGMSAIALGALPWVGYPGAWISATFLLGPIIFGHAFLQRNGIRKLLFGGATSVLLAIPFVAPLATETNSLPVFEQSLSFRKGSSDLSEGILRAPDIASLLFPNPSYFPMTSSPVMHSFYSGVLALFFASFYLVFKRSILRKIASFIIIPFLLFVTLLSNSWHFSSSVLNYIYVLDSFLFPYILYFTAAGIVLLFSPIRISPSKLDCLLIGTCAWVFCVSSDNALGNYLRYYVPPFYLVRYNHIYMWVITLFIPVLGWRALEILINGRTTTILTKEFTLSSILIHLILFVCSILFVASTAIDPTLTERYGGELTSLVSVGIPQLVLQLLLAFCTLILIFVCILLKYFNYSKIQESSEFISGGIFVSSVIVGISLSAWGFWLRANGASPQTIKLGLSLLLLIDLIHVILVLFFACLVLLFVKPSKILLFLCIVTLLDCSTAYARYFMDNRVIVMSDISWPYRVVDKNNAHKLIYPQNSVGIQQKDFWRLFDTTFSPPPGVSAMQQDWGEIATQWVHFPNRWTVSNDELDVWVDRNALPAAVESPLELAPYPKVSRHPINSNFKSSFNQIFLHPRSPVCFSFTNVVNYNVVYISSTKVRIDVEISCDRLLVFTDSWAPGWQVAVDGIEGRVVRVNGAYRGVELKGGRHSVTWKYVPVFSTFLIVLFVINIVIIISFFYFNINMFCIIL